MGWRFRKIFNLGLFRMSMGKSGLGFSFGIPGLRYGISPDGRRYISFGIPGLGLYWIKYFNVKSGKSKTTNNHPIKSSTSTKKDNVPWWKQNKI